MKNLETISDRLQNVHSDVEKSALACHRSSKEIRVIAVSKYISPKRILEAYNVGQRIFGENRIQELALKYQELPKDIAWHMIGHLQTNKAKIAVECSTLIHSVDSPKLLRKIHDHAQRIEKRQPILLQVNIAAELSKHGATIDSTEKMVIEVQNMPFVLCQGFMTMAPQHAKEEEIRHIFQQLRLFRDKMVKQLGGSFPELSMGMSDDFTTAIEEGATYIRIGRAIFGAR